VNIPFSSFPVLSFRSLLICKIQAAIESAQIVLPAAKASTAVTPRNFCLLPQSALTIAPTEISLNRLKVTVPIQYVSAIAFRLVHRFGIDAAPIEIAQTIAAQLHQAIAAAQASANPDALDATQHPDFQQVWQTFTVQTAEPGWIYLQPSDRGVAIWLQSLISPQLHLSSSTRLSFDSSKGTVASNAFNTRNSTRIFPLLYTHARCCSMLQLANQTEIIRLDRSEFAASIENSASNSAVDLADSGLKVSAEPQVFPWLLEPESPEPDALQPGSQRSNSVGRLRCQHPAEQQLISQLVNTLDQLDRLNQLNRRSNSQAAPALEHLTQCRKLAQALSQDFQSFYAACRIWGEVEQTDLPLAQARLGLVWIVQKVMRSLLAELGIEAPIEL
jgi:DALR anticodon binding domain